MSLKNPNLTNTERNEVELDAKIAETDCACDSERDSNRVDLLNTARETQLRDVLDKQANTIKVIAPAKINLHLHVGDTRADGYHEVNTIMHTLALHDVLYISRVPYQNEFMGPVREDDKSPALHVKTIMIGCDGIEVPHIGNEDNLVTKAVRLLAEKIEKTRKIKISADPIAQSTQHGTNICSAHECIEIRVEKHIPAQAGLGGGSADAAAALKGAAQLWDIAPDDPILLDCAKSLGSDVPFFLQGGCAEYAGRGDEFMRSLCPSKTNVLLVCPPAGLSTAEVYKEFDTIRTSSSDKSLLSSSSCEKTLRAELGTVLDEKSLGSITNTDTNNPTPANNATNNGSAIIPSNYLTPAAERLLPVLRDLRAWLTEQTCVSDVIMCGSGSCLCAFCDSFTSASRLSASSHLRDCWTRTTALANLKAQVMPAK